MRAGRRSVRAWAVAALGTLAMLAAAVPTQAARVPRAWFYLTNDVGGGAPDIDFLYRYIDEIPFGADWADRGEDWVITVEPVSRRWEWYYSDLDGDDSYFQDRSVGQFTYPNFEYFEYGSVELGHVPVVGDWDGENAVGGRTMDPDTGEGSRNRDTPGVAVPTKDDKWQWRLNDRNDSTSGDRPPEHIFIYGNARTDIPVSGDWDGDGDDTIGVVRRLADGTLRWLLKNENAAGSPDHDFPFGNWRLGDRPVVGDWDGSGFDMQGVVRPNDRNGHWIWLLRCQFTAGAPMLKFEYGSTALGDIPFPGDWDGNGVSTAGVARPKNL